MAQPNETWFWQEQGRFGAQRHASAAKNPHAAMLTREFIFSDKGQLNLARGYARPIRFEHLTIPEDVQKKLLPQAQYAKAKPVTDAAAWEKSSKELPSLWQQKVLINQ